MNQHEVASWLSCEMPEIKSELQKFSPTINIYKSIQCLSDYTRKKVCRKEMIPVTNCFTIAEKLYSQGNAIVQNAIENVFVYSFAAMLDSLQREDKKELRRLIPGCLYSVYVRQILHPGI